MQQQSDTNQQLAGKAVVVTGAGRGIGKGVAIELVRRGASVLVVDRDGDAVDATVEQLESTGGQAAGLTVDLIEATAGEAIVARAIDAFGHLDALVNNAQASCGAKPFVEQTEEDWELAHGTGPRATFRLMKAAYPHLKQQGGGSIVNFGSGAGSSGLPLFATYGSAKEAIRGLTKVAALEWGPDNIRVNCITPAAMTEGMAGWAEAQPEAFQGMLAQVPLRRVGDPQSDIGPTVAFLISDDSAYVSGVTLSVEGGAGTYR